MGVPGLHGFQGPDDFLFHGFYVSPTAPAFRVQENVSRTLVRQSTRDNGPDATGWLFNLTHILPKQCSAEKGKEPDEEEGTG